MIRFLITGLLIAHGLIHIAIYAKPSGAAREVPFDPSRSWALAGAHVGATPMRSTSQALGLAVAPAYAIAGWGIALDVAAWTAAAAVAAILGLALKGLWFNPWLLYGIALDIGVLAAIATGWPPSLF